MKMKIRQKDTEQWLENLNSMKALELYRKYKTEIKQETWHDNTEGSSLMMRARTQTLQLNWRNRHRGKATQCPACNHEEETQQHFILYCTAYDNIRRFNLVNSDQSEEDKLAEILLLKNNEKTEQKKRFLKQIWHKRRQIIKTQTTQ